MAASFRATPVKKNKKLEDVFIDETGAMVEKSTGRKIATKSSRQTTQAVEVELASDRRSVKRELFESAKKEKELRLAQETAAEEERLRQEEEAEIRRIRLESTFRATPVHKYNLKLGEVEPTRLTKPISPQLTTK